MRSWFPPLLPLLPELPPPLLELLLLLLPQAASASTEPTTTHPFMALPRNRIRLLFCRCWALGCPTREGNGAIRRHASRCGGVQPLPNRTSIASDRSANAP